MNLKKIVSCIEHHSNKSALTFVSPKSEIHDLPDYTNVSAMINESLKFGQGVSTNPNNSSLIALMELIERFYLGASFPISFHQKTLFSKKTWLKKNIKSSYPTAEHWLPNSSNGLAVHSKKHLAFDNGLAELIERHTILKALAESIVPAQCAPPVCLIDGTYKVNKPLTADFFYWEGPLKHFVVVMRVKQGLKTMYSFGSRKNLEHAKKKAFFEMVPRIYHMENVTSQKRDYSSQNPHFNFHWNEDTPWTDNFFSEALTTKTAPIVSPNIKKSDIFYVLREKPTFLKQVSGLHAIHVFCPLMQQLFAGNWEPAKINPAAVSTCDLPPEKHIIG